MDYPKSVPNIGLVGGKFVDENTSTGQVGSLIPAVWGTAVTDEIVNVIKESGLLPKENENNQLAAAIKEIIKSNAAAKGTKLSDYGITDAISSTPQLGTVGAISDIQKTTFGTYASGTSDKPSSGGLFMRIKYPAGPLAIDFAGHAGTAGSQYFLRRSNVDNGVGAWDEVWHSGNFNPALKAPTANPTFTGAVTVPNLAAGTNDWRAANTAFVQAAIASLVGSSPTTLDTLNELAAALGNDPNFATTMVNALAGKASSSALDLKADKTSAFGAGQTWQDVTSGRAAATTYTNSTGRPIVVSIYTTLVTNWSASITVSGVVVATNTTNNMTSGGIGTLTAIVPPGGTYSFSSTFASINKWMEMR